MDAGGKHVRVEREGAVALVTVDRQDKLNAMDEGVKRGILAALGELRSDPAARVAVITGAGDRAFIAGADISEFARRTPGEHHAVAGALGFYEAVDSFPKPLLAMVNGYCLGGGLELALACDLRVASDRARFGQAEVNIGIIPGGGASQRLPRLVGYGQALRLILTGDQVDAHEALAMGLVEMMVPHGELRARTMALASHMAEKSPVALALAKEAVRASLRTGLDQGLALEAQLFLKALGSEDGREGVKAFLEKRKPSFTGR